MEFAVGNILFGFAIGAFSSHSLVTTDRHDPEIPKADFVSPLIAHRGAIAVPPRFGALFALMQHYLKRLFAS
ncbi:MAG: hypothetical protein HYY78_19575 [Betaproteobacteria bacterium]|nr:hypothetical protein [Betaproteobacteria bacterium]